MCCILVAEFQIVSFTPSLWSERSRENRSVQSPCDWEELLISLAWQQPSCLQLQLQMPLCFQGPIPLICQWECLPWVFLLVKMILVQLDPPPVDGGEPRKLSVIVQHKKQSIWSRYVCMYVCMYILCNTQNFCQYVWYYITYSMWQISLTSQYFHRFILRTLSKLPLMLDLGLVRGEPFRPTWHWRTLFKNFYLGQANQLPRFPYPKLCERCSSAWERHMYVHALFSCDSGIVPYVRYRTIRYDTLLQPRKESILILPHQPWFDSS